MGLLDDAIREHLELKRRRGAEPEEIARVEREALDPTDGELEAVFDGYDAMAAEADAHADQLYSPAAVSQETVELDMQTVLDEDVEVAQTGSSPTAEHLSGAGADRSGLYSHQEEPLDWDMPQQTDEPVERLPFE